MCSTEHETLPWLDRDKSIWLLRAEITTPTAQKVKSMHTLTLYQNQSFLMGIRLLFDPLWILSRLKRAVTSYILHIYRWRTVVLHNITGWKEKIYHKRFSAWLLIYLSSKLEASPICLPFSCQASQPVLQQQSLPWAYFPKQEAHCRPRGPEPPTLPLQNAWSGSGDCGHHGCLAEETWVQHEDKHTERQNEIAVEKNSLNSIFSSTNSLNAPPLLVSPVLYGWSRK